MLFVGGELYTDKRWRLEQRVPFPRNAAEHTCFLNGGQACLRVIGDYLHGMAGCNQILLPAYLCPTIPRTLQRCGLQCDFYAIHEDFSIDLDDLAQHLAAAPQAGVYFIDYFGFSPLPPVLDFLAELQQSHILIEDNAQGGFLPAPRGNLCSHFTFNSLRKLCAYDGAYLNATVALESFLTRYAERPNWRLPLIRAYRERLAQYLFCDEGDPDELDALFEQAERHYESDEVVWGDEEERAGIEHLDWPTIRQVRRENYLYLLERLSAVAGVTPIFPSLQEDQLPLGLPVYFTGLSRDRVAAALGEAQIGLTIHWENIHPNPRTPAQRQAMEMSQHILTLPTDQYTTPTQLDYLLEQLDIAVRAEKHHASLKNLQRSVK